MCLLGLLLKILKMLLNSAQYTKTIFVKSEIRSECIGLGECIVKRVKTPLE